LSIVNVVYCERCLLWTLSIVNVVYCERCLLWTLSIVNVVCCEHCLDKIQMQMFLLRCLCLMLCIQINNKNLNAKRRRCNNVMQWKDAPCQKTIEYKKNSCATSRNISANEWPIYRYQPQKTHIGRSPTNTIKKSQAKHCFVSSSSDKNMGLP